MTGQDAHKGDKHDKPDADIEKEFAEVISVVKETRRSEPVPAALDKKVKRFARRSPIEELESNWFFGSGARLILGMLVFFAIAMIWLSL